jgi:predicted Rdx family selenoprotein
MFTASALSDRLAWHTVHHIHDPDSSTPPLTYTDGLAQRPGRAYELAVTGLGYWLANNVLTAAAEQLADDCLDPAEGMELDRVLTRISVRLRRAQGNVPLPGIAPRARVWQVLTPDKWGHFPGDHHYSLPGWPQPLL